MEFDDFALVLGGDCDDLQGAFFLRPVNLQAAVDGVDLDGGEIGGGCGVGCIALEDDGGKPVALDIQIQTPARPEGALFIEVGGSEFWD